MNNDMKKETKARDKKNREREGEKERDRHIFR